MGESFELRIEPIGIEIQIQKDNRMFCVRPSLIMRCIAVHTRINIRTHRHGVIADLRSSLSAIHPESKM